MIPNMMYQNLLGYAYSRSLLRALLGSTREGPTPIEGGVSDEFIRDSVAARGFVQHDDASRRTRSHCKNSPESQTRRLRASMWYQDLVRGGLQRVCMHPNAAHEETKYDAWGGTISQE